MDARISFTHVLCSPLLFTVPVDLTIDSAELIWTSTLQESELTASTSNFQNCLPVSRHVGIDQIKLASIVPT